MAQLSWSLASQDDVVEIGDFIAKDSIVYAVSVVERLVHCGRSPPVFSVRRTGRPGVRATRAPRADHRKLPARLPRASR